MGYLISFCFIYQQITYGIKGKSIQELLRNRRGIKSQRNILLSLSLILALFAGCGGSSNSQNDSSSPASSSAGEKVEKSDDNPDDEAADPNDMSNLRVAAVFPGPRGDSGTVDMACAAMEKLEAECGLQIEIVEGDGTNDVAKMEASLMDTADEGYDMIISTGTMSDIFRSVGPEYPETVFCLFDTTFDFTTYDANNIYCVNFLQNEVSYLAGIVAMSMSESGVIGFVGGMENANICDFMWGYVEGAKSVNSAGTVAISFTGDWYDSAKAKELTLTQAGMGADVVFPASGPSQQGAYEGAAEAGIYSIGVDVDREALYAESNPEWAEHVLTSALKCVDVAVERAIRLFAAGELEMGQEALGIAEGGVDLCTDGNYSDVVPADVQKVIDDAKAAITNGEVTVGTAIGASADEIAEIKAWAGRTE